MALIDNLVSYWKLDETEAGAAIDSHDDNDGTNHGADINQDGKLNRSYNFVAVSGDYVNIPDSENIDITGNFTICCWVKTTHNPAGDVGIVDRGYGDAVVGGYYLLLGSTTFLRGGFRHAGGHVIATGDTSISTGNWVHIAVTFDGDNVRIYLNGALEATSAPTAVNPPSSENDIVFGGRVSLNGWYNGLIDEIGLWDRQLVLSEIQELYNDGAGLAYPFGAPTAKAKVFGFGKCRYLFEERTTFYQK